jgi:hypothetical protein
MLAVAIFAVAVLALAKSVEAMLNAQIIKDEDEKVRRFMESKMMEIEAGAVPLQDSTTEEIKGWMPDMQLKTTRTPLKAKEREGRGVDRPLHGDARSRVALREREDGALALVLHLSRVQR